MIEEHGWERKKAVLVMGTIIFVVGIACSLSNGGNGAGFSSLVKISLISWTSFLGHISFPLAACLPPSLWLGSWGSKQRPAKKH